MTWMEEAKAMDPYVGFTKYLALDVELLKLIAAGKDDSEEGDAIRDQMEVPWHAVSYNGDQETKDKLNEIHLWLYQKIAPRKEA